MPTPDKKTEKLFYEFAKFFIRKTWSEDCVLRDDDVPSSVKWLEERNYTGARKKQLEKLRSEMERMDRSFAKVESFVKQEGYYGKPKNARGINSPTDWSKLVLGPLVSAVDEKTFKARYFVKGTNPRDWPKRILATLGMEKVVETDFTAFESHHSGVFSKVVYYWMLHMIRNVTRIQPMKDLLSRLIMGRNEIYFKHLKVETDQRLMSGALWTSSANGVLNLMIMSFLSAQAALGGDDPEALANWAHNNFQGFVEGDDGLCKDYGIAPDNIKALGLVLEFTPHRNFAEANFCGITCDPDSLVVMKDPLAAMAKIFLLPPKYAGATRNKKMALLRARALSYLCNFGKTPVLASCCHWILRRSKSISHVSGIAVLDSYHVGDIDETLQNLRLRDYRPEVIDDSSRLIVEDVFGVTVPEQLRMEKAFNESDTDFIPLDLRYHLTDLTVDHSLCFTYHPSEEPRMRPCYMPGVVADILDRGKPATNKDANCAWINKKFARWTQVLPVDIRVGIGD